MEGHRKFWWGRGAGRRRCCALSFYRTCKGAGNFLSMFLGPPSFCPYENNFHVLGSIQNIRIICPHFTFLKPSFRRLKAFEVDF